MSEIAAITQGMQSVQGTGMYTARLDAFAKNAKAFEAYDFNKGFESEAAKKQKDAATFTEVALGFNVIPDSNKMYAKHYALLSKKFETLFSDDNLTAMAATPEGRARFSRAVEQLNQEAKGYESIYSSTFGDPSTADGKGSTYQDHVYRRDKGGGDDLFFQNEGYKIDKKSDDFEQRLRDLDNSAGILDADITFDPSTGTWGGYDPNDELLSMRQDVALRHFSYTADKAIFTPPSNAVAVAGVYDLMAEMSSDDSMMAYARTQIQSSPLDAVAYWQQIKGSPQDKDKSVQELYKAMITQKTIDVATDLFADAMVNEVKARKEREEAEKKKAERSNKTYNPNNFNNTPGIVFGNLPEAEGFSIKGVEGFTINNFQSIPRSIKKSTDGSIELGYTTGDTDLSFIKLNDENIGKFEEFIPGITVKYQALSGSVASSETGGGEALTETQQNKLAAVLNNRGLKSFPMLQKLIYQEGVTKGQVLEATPAELKSFVEKILQASTKVDYGSK